MGNGLIADYILGYDAFQDALQATYDLNWNLFYMCTDVGLIWNDLPNDLNLIADFKWEITSLASKLLFIFGKIALQCVLSCAAFTYEAETLNDLY